MCLTLGLSVCAPLLAQTETESEPVKIQDSALTEISGLAASRKYPGCLWAHNDSGDSARLFLLNPRGETVATVELEGIEARDWEDMTFAGEFLYVGDIGDNFAVMENVRVHRLREPDLDANKRGQNIVVRGAQIETMTLRYEGGPRDAETLAAAPDGRLLIVSKNRQKSGFYATQIPFVRGGTAVLEKIGEHEFGAVGWLTKLTTGGEFAPDGRALAVQTYSQVKIFPLGAAFNARSIRFDAPQAFNLPPLRQSESLCWSVDGKSLWTSTEGKNSPLVRLDIPTAP